MKDKQVHRGASLLEKGNFAPGVVYIHNVKKATESVFLSCLKSSTLYFDPYSFFDFFCISRSKEKLKTNEIKLTEFK